MSKLVNKDFFKNIISPIKLPKIKGRKIFNHKTSCESPQVPTIVDHSPAKISTISSLAENTSQNEEKFGEDEIAKSNSVTEEESENNKEECQKKRLNFNEKLTKSYKDLSEFKFKNILGKKTVVRTTSIDIGNYEHDIVQNDECNSERSDYDFEFCTLPTKSDSFEFDPQIENDEEDEADDNCKEEIKEEDKEPVRYIPPSEVDQEDISDVPKTITPNDSSLFRQLKHSPNQEPQMSTEEASTEKTPKTKLSFNKQTLEDLCNKAKTKVTANLQKFNQKYITRKPQSSQSETDLQTNTRNDKECSIQEISSDEHLENPDEIVTHPSTSFSKIERRLHKKRILKEGQYKETHIPAEIEYISRQDITPPCQRRIVMQDSIRKHNRKPSFDSCDSDSWIAETFNSSIHNKRLNMIEENQEAWLIHTQNKKTVLRKKESVDIFTVEGERAFEDFDDELKNVPTIHISATRQLSEEGKSRPLVKQSSIIWQSSDDISSEEFNVNVNQLISCFEKPENKGSKQKVPREHASKIPKSIESASKDLKAERKYRNSTENMSVVPLRNFAFNNNVADVGASKSMKCSVYSVREEINEDVFHSLDTEEDVLNDLKRQYRHANVRVVYRINV